MQVRIQPGQQSLTPCISSVSLAAHITDGAAGKQMSEGEN